jgi:hypothetical protein
VPPAQLLGKLAGTRRRIAEHDPRTGHRQLLHRAALIAPPPATTTTLSCNPRILLPLPSSDKRRRVYSMVCTCVLLHASHSRGAAHRSIQPRGETLMTLSMYQASIPVLIHNLKTLSAILKKGAAHAKTRGIDPAVLLNARLYPDMFALSRQVQIAADMAKGGGARLAGIEIPSFPDTETTFVELQERLARTIAFLNSIRPEQVDGSEKHDIILPMRIGVVTFPASITC